MESGSSESVFSFLVSRFFTEKMQDKYVQLDLVVVAAAAAVVLDSNTEYLREQKAKPYIIRPNGLKKKSNH